MTNVLEMTRSFFICGVEGIFTEDIIGRRALDERSRKRLRFRGKSGLHRMQRRVTPAGRKIRESATENKPLSLVGSKGEKAR